MSNANNISGFSDLRQVTSTGSIEINDMAFCLSHGKEKCSSCDVDFREDNSFVAGLDMIEEREGLSVETSFNKDGEVQCKKHKSSNCSNCFAFKKQIVKANKEAEKKAKGMKKSTSNFV